MIGGKPMNGSVAGRGRDHDLRQRRMLRHPIDFLAALLTLALVSAVGASASLHGATPVSASTAGAGPAEARPARPGVAPMATVPRTNGFPVPAPWKASFSNDWHACRDGCRRRHQGNDVFARERTPIVAVETGTITKVDNVDNGRGGLSIWLRGRSGVAYYYAHNSVNYVKAGQRVARGQLIGRVGRTGNARTTPSHIHFQINRCGRRNSDEPCTVNPYPYLTRWRRTAVAGSQAVGTYRLSTASTRLRTEGGSPLPAFRYGRPPEATSLPVAGDWNGDGRATVGLYRRSDASFWRRNDRGRSPPPVRFGTPGNTGLVPVAGDWNGDGRDSLGLYRRSDATFLLRDDAGRTLPPVSFGWPGAADVHPVVGDWNGDGRDSLGLYRSVDGLFRLRDDNGHNLPPVAYGTPVRRHELPVAGDWNGDGRDTVGIYQPADATFRLSGPDPARPTRGATSVETGERPAADVVPLAGDWNGLDVVTFHDLDAIFGPFTDEAAVRAQLPVLNDAMLRAGATTAARKAAFLATIHNESNFRADAVEHGNQSKYRGRGLIQLTGGFNYRAAGADLGLDLAAQPDLAAKPDISAQVAAWYWTIARDINFAADRLDMAAVNMAIGYEPSPRRDTQRCGDFVRALKWFNGGKLPEGVNCGRSVISQLIAFATVLRSSTGGGTWEGAEGTGVTGSAAGQPTSRATPGAPIPTPPRTHAPRSPDHPSDGGPPTTRTRGTGGATRTTHPSTTTTSRPPTTTTTGTPSTTTSTTAPPTSSTSTTEPPTTTSRPSTTTTEPPTSSTTTESPTTTGRPSTTTTEPPTTTTSTTTTSRPPTTTSTSRPPTSTTTTSRPPTSTTDSSTTTTSRPPTTRTSERSTTTSRPPTTATTRPPGTTTAPPPTTASCDPAAPATSTAAPRPCPVGSDGVVALGPRYRIRLGPAYARRTVTIVVTGTRAEVFHDGQLIRAVTLDPAAPQPL